MNPLEAIAANRERHETNDAKAQADNDELPELIRNAFDAGYTGPQIATVARVSKERTYQLRDGRR